MPSVQLPGIQEFPQYEVVESPPAPLYSDRDSALDTDYYPGGFDIESDFPPPPDHYPPGDELPPPPPLPEYGPDRFDSLRPPGRDHPGAAPASPGSPGGVRQRPALPQLYDLNQYLPQHSYPAGEGGAEAQGQAAASTAAAAAAPPSATRGSPSPPSSTMGTGGYRGGYPMGYGRDFEAPALDNMSLSLYTSTASCSDMSACCEESDAVISDYESGDEGRFGRTSIPGLDSQQHTEV